MYLQEVLGQQRHKERLQEAQRYRVASQVRALSRAQRRLAQAQRQMSKARARDRRIRLELEAQPWPAATPLRSTPIECLS